MDASLLVATSLGLAMALAPAVARAAELQVLAGGATAAIMGELGPAFERATGHKLAIRFGGTPELIRLASSTPFDVACVPIDVFQDAAAKAKFVAGPTTDIAHVGFGVAIRAGAPKPDISTPDAFKATMLKAQSVTFYPESASGAHIARTFERLGITDAMKAKTKAVAYDKIAETVAKGDAELGMFVTNVLIAPGVDIAGPFPGDLQKDLVFTSGVAAETKQAEAARAFTAFLRTPEAIAVIKAKGMVPG